VNTQRDEKNNFPSGPPPPSIPSSLVITPLPAEKEALFVDMNRRLLKDETLNSDGILTLRDMPRRRATDVIVQ